MLWKNIHIYNCDDVDHFRMHNMVGILIGFAESSNSSALLEKFD